MLVCVVYLSAYQYCDSVFLAVSAVPCVLLPVKDNN